MGQNISKDIEYKDFQIKDSDNILVIIEKCPGANISEAAEGMYVLPKNTNCVRISDLVFSLVKTPILLYMCGQDVTHNYTPIEMYESMKENDCLYFLYSERYERIKESVMIEDHIQDKDIDVSGPLRLKIIPKKPNKGSKHKLKIWEECTVHQLELIMHRIIKKTIHLYYNNEKLDGNAPLSTLKEKKSCDGVIHIDYCVINE